VVHHPVALMNSPALMAAACPTTATKSRCPRALTRRTQKEAVLGIVVGDALHQAGQRLRRGGRSVCSSLIQIRASYILVGQRALAP